MSGGRRLAAGLALAAALRVEPAAGGGGAMPIERRTSHFGVLKLEDGDVALMDGGIHGVQGHTLHIPAAGDARWARRVDSVRPSGRAAEGTFTLTAGERAQLARWCDDAWAALAPRPRADGPPPVPQIPRWVYAVALRRGGEVRLLEGGTFEPAPPAVGTLLNWLVERVDRLSEAAPPER